MIRTVNLTDRLYPRTYDDCMVLKRTEQQVHIAFPFQEDTPVFHLSISEAMSLKLALEEILNIKLLVGGSD